MLSKIKSVAGCTLLVGAAVPAQAQTQTQAQAQGEENKPNFVVYLTEDLSPHYLAMFNDGKGAKTPNLEKLAAEGINYTNTYSNAPVSSAARTTLITGCYAPRVAGSFHRAIEHFSLPENLHMFPYYLRQAGYYTHNAKKTDYNIVLDEEAWDDNTKENFGWRKRKDNSQPFFYNVTNMVTHEFNLHFSEETFKNKKTKNDPATVNLHSYLPDTELMRYSYATIYDRIESSDAELGRIVEALRKDGELDDTFIFFMGDNGGVLPGTKGYTNNIGYEVPMVVYVPKNYRDMISREIGTQCDALVSFMDIAPTLLNLAGAEIPKEMDGQPFLGEHSKDGRKAVYGYGDRYDERYSFNRMIRVGDMRYARNYQPYQPNGLYAFYRYKQLAFKEWFNMYEDGKLTEEQAKFFEAQPAEELYDLKNDPMEQVNLAGDPRYAATLRKLSSMMNKNMDKMCDLGFMPECLTIEEGLENTERFAKDNKKRIVAARKIADLQCVEYSKASKKLKKAMQSTDDVQRWWALTTAASFGAEAADLKDVASKDLTAQRAYVRSRAMIYAAVQGEKISQKDIQTAVSMSKNISEALLVLNDVTYLVDYGFVPQFEIDIKSLPFSYNEINQRVDHIAGRLF